MGIISRIFGELPRRASVRGVTGLLLLGCAGTPSEAPPAWTTDGRYVMGTLLEITVAAPTPDQAEAAVSDLFELATNLEKVFTSFDPESPVRRLSGSAGQHPRRVDAHLARILQESVAYSKLTRGSFDVTVDPLIALWRMAARRQQVPSASELDTALERVGAEKIRLESGDRVALERPGMSVNLGGIAKGYALDRMAERLRERGHSRAFVSFGQSSILALGAPPDASAWRVLLSEAGGGFSGIAQLRNQTLSLSGSLGDWTEIAGRRYGHVIDPRSGQALTRAAQAAVLAPSGALAEALSKALLVLPPREGLALLESRPGVEGLLVEADGSARASPGWDRAVAFESFRVESDDPRDQAGTRQPRDAPRRRGPEASGWRAECGGALGSSVEQNAPCAET